MIHPSYVELMKVVNTDTSIGEEPVVNSRYSIVIAAAKRARQIIGGAEPLVPNAYGKKPLSIAVEELYEGEVKILSEEEAQAKAEEEAKAELEEAQMETEEELPVSEEE
jgi:DNA-directed RNA polymerase subunit omega